MLVESSGYSTRVSDSAASVPATLALAGLGFFTAVVLAVAIAFLSSLAPFSWLRNAIQSLPSLFISVPVFWLGIVLIQVFSFQLKLIPVINPPQAAILGVGAVREVLTRVDGEIVDRRLLTLTLSCDHRILNGADASRYLADVRALLEAPLRMALA